jgi:hypothetical protein
MKATLSSASLSASPYQVVLSLQNNSADIEYLALPRLGNPRFDGKYFEFQPAADIQYKGMQVKRLGYGIDKMIPLEVGRTLKVNINLSEHFDIKLSESLQVRYTASHPLKGIGANMVMVTSEWLSLP